RRLRRENATKLADSFVERRPNADVAELLLQRFDRLRVEREAIRHAVRARRSELASTGDPRGTPSTVEIDTAVLAINGNGVVARYRLAVPRRRPADAHARSFRDRLARIAELLKLRPGTAGFHRPVL